MVMMRMTLWLLMGEGYGGDGRASSRRGHHSPYLNVGDAQAGDSADSGPRDARRLEGQHGLEISLQICYSRRHFVDQSAVVGRPKNATLLLPLTVDS